MHKIFKMELREKILKRISEKFRRMGIKSITMDSLASELGMSKRTLYEMFRQKDDLVLEAIRYMIVKENDEMLKIIEQSSHVVEALYFIMKGKKEMRETFSDSFQKDIKKYLPAIQESLFADRQKLQKYSASFVLLEKGKKAAIFRPEINIELVDSFIQEMIIIIHSSSRIKAIKPNETEILHHIFIPYFRGLCTGKGLELMDKFFVEINEIK